MMTDAYAKELKSARRAAVKAGAFLRAAQHGADVVKRPHGEGYLDVTTREDLQAERIILDRIQRAFPADRILSEESHPDLVPTDGRLWVIDPLDGTTNYVKGLPAYGVSIALLVDGVVQMAVAYLPATRELYDAVRGQGVRLGGKPLTLAEPEERLAQSLVSVGFPHTRTKGTIDDAFTLYASLLGASSDLRRSASAVVDACWLAAGKTGAYITPDIKPWDIVTGVLFVEEQGGVASDFTGAPLDVFKHDGDRFSVAVVFAKNVAIHREVVTLTQSHAS